jgi:hypothetical protein
VPKLIHTDLDRPARLDGLVALALLGAVFPENVVLRSASDDTYPASAGKAGPARFVITLPDER